MDDTAVFTEYSKAGDWIAVHFAQWASGLLLLFGLVGLYHALKNGSGLVRGIGRFGVFTTVQAAAAITALQVVDGIALKWAVDTWVNAQGEEKTAMFAAAEAVRWTEYAFQSYSNILIGLALIAFGFAMVVSTSYPRWLGGIAAASGVAWIIHGVMVAYVGLFDSMPRLVAMVLLVIWSATTAVMMWRRTRGPRAPHITSPAVDPAMI